MQEKHVETAKLLLGEGQALNTFLNMLLDDIANLKAMLHAISIGGCSLCTFKRPRVVCSVRQVAHEGRRPCITLPKLPVHGLVLSSLAHKAIAFCSWHVPKLPCLQVMSLKICVPLPLPTCCLCWAGSHSSSASHAARCCWHVQHLPLPDDRGAEGPLAVRISRSVRCHLVTSLHPLLVLTSVVLGLLQPASLPMHSQTLWWAMARSGAPTCSQPTSRVLA